MNDDYKKIVEKINKDTYGEFMEFIRYLLRYSNNGAVHIIHKYITEDKIDDIYKKRVCDLNEEDRLNLLIHWAFKHGGIDKFRETPFSIIEHLTDAEVVQEFNRRLMDKHSSVGIKFEAMCASRVEVD